MTSASGGGNEVGGVEGLEPAWGVSGASKQGREIKQIPLGPSLGGGSPAFPWLGRPNPPGQWLPLGSGRSKGAGLEGLWWARAQGNTEAFLLEINCKETVQIILQMSPHSGGSWWWHFFAGTAETQLSERRVGWGGDTTLGWVEGLGNQSKEETAKVWPGRPWGWGGRH